MNGEVIKKYWINPSESFTFRNYNILISLFPREILLMELPVLI